MILRGLFGVVSWLQEYLDLDFSIDIMKAGRDGHRNVFLCQSQRLLARLKQIWFPSWESTIREVMLKGYPSSYTFMVPWNIARPSIVVEGKDERVVFGDMTLEEEWILSCPKQIALTSMFIRLKLNERCDVKLWNLSFSHQTHFEV